MDINLADVNVHIINPVDLETQANIENSLRALDGVVSVRFQTDNAHLVLVDFNRDKLKGHDILDCVQSHSVKATMIGL
ncbi:ATP-binding protein [Candidatus Venteria ishoeyi]|uniref:HMA domain-containing protein n=1 Tax=Candidatus Venteria ishoeyi TaxID=1899563 RepID=A0A1H6F9G4_9GAMM|nr:ATP-binding protein [Candidatus Venteria ishoeyi]MDM8545456.1 hypothetical protein [Candidatus Venteria ishoeyi]SEH06742.1 Uncharacterised protein [Candidatus Venteria ishoeyi]